MFHRGTRGAEERKRGVDEGERVKDKVQRRRGEEKGEEVRRKGRRDRKKLEKGWVVKGGREEKGENEYERKRRATGEGGEG